MSRLRKKILIAGLFVALFAGFPQSQVASAQRTTDPKTLEAWRERDNTVSNEKIARVKGEAAALQESIIQRVKNKFPEYRVDSTRIADPAIQGLSRRGQTSVGIVWKKNGGMLSLTVDFFLLRRRRFNITCKDSIEFPWVRFFLLPNFLERKQ